MHPQGRELLKVSPARAGPETWDDPTVVAPEQSEDMQIKPRSLVKKRRSSSPLSKNRAEKYPCVYPGCARKFVKQAELRNHIWQYLLVQCLQSYPLPAHLFPEAPESARRRTRFCANILRTCKRINAYPRHQCRCELNSRVWDRSMELRKGSGVVVVTNRAELYEGETVTW